MELIKWPTVTLADWHRLSPGEPPRGVRASPWRFLNEDHNVSDEIRKLFYFCWMLNSARRGTEGAAVRAHDLCFGLIAIPELSSWPVLAFQEQAKVNFLADYTTSGKFLDWTTGQTWGVKDADMMVWRWLGGAEREDCPVTATNLLRSIITRPDGEGSFARELFRRSGYDTDMLCEALSSLGFRHSFGSLVISAADSGLTVTTLEATGTVRVRNPKDDSPSVLYGVHDAGGLLLPKERVVAFEQLINGHPSELEIQAFLESNPWLLWLADYAAMFPHLTLSPPWSEETYIPDFLMKRVSGSLYDVVDLKTPDVTPVVGPTRRRQFSRALKDSIAQLREYRDFFDDGASRRWFEEAYHIEPPYKPGMAVVIGRDTHFDGPVERRKIELDSPVRIVTYDDLLRVAQYRSLIVPSTS